MNAPVLSCPIQREGCSKTWIALCAIASFSAMSLSHADFIADSQQEITLKSYYQDKSFKNKNIYGFLDVDNWTQAALYKFSSGYTDTPVQIGLDLSLKYAISTHDNENVNFITSDLASPYKHKDLFKPGATLKFKYQDSELKVGELFTDQNLYAIGEDPVLPGTFWGANFTQKLNPNWSVSIGSILYGARPYEDTLRKIAPSYIANLGTPYYESPHMDRFNVMYIKDRRFAYYDFVRLKDIYAYHFLNLKQGFDHDINVSVKLLKTDDDGKKGYGDIDAGLAAIMLDKQIDAHRLSLGYQHVFGNYSYNNYGGLLNGNLFNFSTYGLSGREKKEDSYVVAYDYDFTPLGIPGLKPQVFYVQGNHIEYGNIENGREKEWGLNLTYLIPDGKFKGLGFKTVYTHYTNNYSAFDFNDVRTWLYYQKTF